MNIELGNNRIVVPGDPSSLNGATTRIETPSVVKAFSHYVALILELLHMNHFF